MPNSTTEKAVLSRLVDYALALKYMISVGDSEGIILARSTDAKAIIEAAEAVEAATLTFRRQSTKEAVGWIHVIWGNAADGSELLADYSYCLPISSLVAEANKASFARA